MKNKRMKYPKPGKVMITKEEALILAMRSYKQGSADECDNFLNAFEETCKITGRDHFTIEEIRQFITVMREHIKSEGTLDHN